MERVLKLVEILSGSRSYSEMAFDQEFPSTPSKKGATSRAGGENSLEKQEGQVFGNGVGDSA